MLKLVEMFFIHNVKNLKGLIRYFQVILHLKQPRSPWATLLI